MSPKLPQIFLSCPVEILNIVAFGYHTTQTYESFDPKAILKFQAFFILKKWVLSSKWII
jgi:hypothetical protein